MSKLSDEQRAQLLAAHRRGGLAAVRPLARKFGCSEDYAAQLARKAGDPRKRPGRRFRNDPRWRWAIERGGISL